MSDLHDLLTTALAEIEGVKVALWKDSALLCVTYKDKEIAHFHGKEVIDMRLTPKHIQSLGLPRAIEATSHPERSPKSRWIEVRYASQKDIDLVITLAKIAIELRQSGK